jgi:hypothetical protein
VIFTRATPTPAAAAERSLARTASICEPSWLRRSMATPTATTAGTTRHAVDICELIESNPYPLGAC